MATPDSQYSGVDPMESQTWLTKALEEAQRASKSPHGMLAVPGTKRDASGSAPGTPRPVFKRAREEDVVAHLTRVANIPARLLCYTPSRRQTYGRANWTPAAVVEKLIKDWEPLDGQRHAAEEGYAIKAACNAIYNLQVADAQGRAHTIQHNAHQWDMHFKLHKDMSIIPQWFDSLGRTESKQNFDAKRTRVSSFLLNLKSQQGLHSASAYEHHAFDGLMQALVTALERLHAVMLETRGDRGDGHDFDLYIVQELGIAIFMVGTSAQQEYEGSLLKHVADIEAWVKSRQAMLPTSSGTTPSGTIALSAKQEMELRWQVAAFAKAAQDMRAQHWPALLSIIDLSLQFASDLQSTCTHNGFGQHEKVLAQYLGHVYQYRLHFSQQPAEAFEATRTLMDWLKLWQACGGADHGADWHPEPSAIPEFYRHALGGRFALSPDHVPDGCRPVSAGHSRSVSAGVSPAPSARSAQ